MSGAYRIVKTQSHRARAQLASAAPGVVGPYWVGAVRNGERSDSMFDRVNAEFWLVPRAEMTERVPRIKGATFPVQIVVADLHPWSGWGSSSTPAPEPLTLFRLEELREALRDERISYGELAELQSLAPYIDSGDVELLEAAGVPEETTAPTRHQHEWEQKDGYKQCECGDSRRTPGVNAQSELPPFEFTNLNDHESVRPYLPGYLAARLAILGPNAPARAMVYNDQLRGRIPGVAGTEREDSAIYLLQGMFRRDFDAAQRNAFVATGGHLANQLPDGQVFRGDLAVFGEYVNGTGWRVREGVRVANQGGRILYWPARTKNPRVEFGGTVYFRPADKSSAAPAAETEA